MGVGVGEIHVPGDIDGARVQLGGAEACIQSVRRVGAADTGQRLEPRIEDRFQFGVAQPAAVVGYADLNAGVFLARAHHD